MRGHWRKLKQGKRSDWTPFPTESRGTESVVLYKRNDNLLKEEHAKNIKSLLAQAGNTSSDIKPDEKVFDKLIQSTKEGMFKHWEVQHTYREKNRLLAIDVSPDNSCRALQIMDLFIKPLRFKGFDISVDQRVTFALIDGERISISLREKKTRDGHPTGFLYFRKEGRHSEKRDWRDGKVLLEDQLLAIFHELLQAAKEMKEERARIKKVEEEREAQARFGSRVCTKAIGRIGAFQTTPL